MLVVKWNEILFLRKTKMTDCNLWEDRDVRFDITLQWVQLKVFLFFFCFYVCHIVSLLSLTQFVSCTCNRQMQLRPGEVSFKLTVSFKIHFIFNLRKKNIVSKWTVVSLFRFLDILFTRANFLFRPVNKTKTLFC